MALHQCGAVGAGIFGYELIASGLPPGRPSVYCCRTTRLRNVVQNRAWLGFLVTSEPHPVHVIGLFSTRSTTDGPR
jgi:hypothetical protein